MADRYVWHPTPYFLEESRLAQFMRKHDIPKGDWRALLQRSKDVHWFYQAMFDELRIEWLHPYKKLCDDSRGMPWTKWFIDGRINITHNCIDRHVRYGRGGNVALRYENENGWSTSISYYQLFRLVHLISRSLKQYGVGKGDIVGMRMTVSPESVALMFACFKIGAVCMQMAPSTSPSETIAHIEATNAKILFTNDGYRYKGEWHSSAETVNTLLEKTIIQTIVVFPATPTTPVPYPMPRVIPWTKFIGVGESFVGMPKTERCNAEDPALILFSSGTTGVSKRIVHTHGGILAQAPKEVGFIFDCKPSDIFMWVTQFGWMMAPYELVGALCFGASVVIYDGAPFYPTTSRIYALIAKHRISIFGFTPSGVRTLAKADEKGEVHPDKHDLSSLRILGSTGDVFNEKHWQWYFERMGKGRLPIINIWGGTEAFGSLGHSMPIMPLKPGTVGDHALGIATDVWDEEGKPVRGQPGYGVVTAPFPSMTRGFYGNNEQYLETYFRQFGENVWSHNDRLIIDADGYGFHLGRSDDLIVRNGTKFDPRKIANTLVVSPGKPAIQDAAVIGIPDADVGHRICAFVVAEGHPSDIIDVDSLRREYLPHLRREYDSRIVLDLIFCVSAIPRNRAAKIPHALIRKSFLGEELGDLSKIVNPDALHEIARIGEAFRKAMR